MCCPLMGRPVCGLRSSQHRRCCNGALKRSTTWPLTILLPINGDLTHLNESSWSSCLSEARSDQSYPTLEVSNKHSIDVFFILRLPLFHCCYIILEEKPVGPRRVVPLIVCDPLRFNSPYIRNPSVGCVWRGTSSRLLLAYVRVRCAGFC